MTPRICASISPHTIPEALRLVERSMEVGADLVEVRLDSLKTHEGLADLAKHGNIVKVATNRLIRNGGEFTGNELAHKQTLLSAVKSGFEYVDIDLSTSNLKEFATDINKNGAQVIVSFHNFNGALTLSELDHLLKREMSSGADVCKIVTTAAKVEDNLLLLDFTAAASKKTKIICFAMGAAGRVSRVLSPMFGGFLSFATLERGQETAPGQMTIQEMRTVYRLLGI